MTDYFKGFLIALLVIFSLSGIFYGAGYNKGKNDEFCRLSCDDIGISECYDEIVICKGNIVIRREVNE